MKTNALLVKRVTDYLDPYFRQIHSYHIDNKRDRIEVIGNTDGEPTSFFSFVEIVIKEEWKQVYLPKIYLPVSMRHRGTGKQLIKVIYNAAKELGFELFIVQMTDSFYARMRKRGALKCEAPDMVQIVDSTMLD